MVRQAHVYLVGAMSGAVLIAIAIAVVVMLLFAQATKQWPVVEIGGGTDHPAAISARDPGGAVADPSAVAVSGGGPPNIDPLGDTSPLGSGVEKAPGPATEPPGKAGPGIENGTQAAPGPEREAGRVPPSPAPVVSEDSRTPTPTPVTETVEATVREIDSTVIGDGLEYAEVIAVTDGAVYDVVDPESTAWQTGEETVDTVDGWPGDPR
jgi:hypothetical protein